MYEYVYKKQKIIIYFFVRGGLIIISNEFICFDDLYIVDIDKAFLDGNHIIFKLKDDEGLFKFNYRKGRTIPYDSWLGRFLWLKKDLYLTTYSIIEIVSTFNEVDTYCVPRSVRFIPNRSKKF